MSDKKKKFMENIRFINNDFSFTPAAGKLELQDDVLDSRAQNITFENIEKELNTLYEKTRVLEDVVAYAKDFLEQQIHIYREKVQNKLRVIEDSRDSLKDSNFITYVVPFVTDRSVVTKDRDGSTIHVSDISNGKIIMSGQELDSAGISKASKTQELKAYNDNLKDIPSGKPYRSFYLVDGPATNGVKEEITVMFNEPTRVNFIKINPSNCEIAEVSLINEHGIEEQLDDMMNEYNQPKDAIGAKFTIVSRNYSKEVYEFDNSRISSGFWDRIKEHEYRNLIGQETIFDMEKEAGLEKYRRDYQDYLDALKRWEEEKAAVERRNRLVMEQYERDLAEWTRLYG